MTKPQVILDDGGKPAFAVIPWKPDLLWSGRRRMGE